MRLPKLWVCGFWGMVLASVAVARPFQVTVKEKGTGKPLSRVEVRVGEEVFYTDPSGQVRLEVPEGALILFYRAEFETLNFDSKGFSDQLDQEVYLYPAAPSDNEVIVSGRAKREVSRKDISIEEAKAVAPRGDPAQITKSLPGVQSSGFSPEVAVRGSAPEDSRYYIDRFSVPFVYHSVGGISVLPDKLLEQVSFSAGGFGPQYGEATGGVVELETSQSVPSEGFAQFKVNVPIYSGFYVEQPVGERAVVSASGRRSYLDAFIQNFFDDEDMVIVPKFFDAHLRYFERTDTGYLKLLTLSSYDGLYALVPGDGGDVDGNVNFSLDNYYGLLGVEYTDKLSKDWRYLIAPQGVYARNQIDVADNFIEIKGPQVRLPVEFQYRLKGADKVYLGFEVERFDVKVDVLAPRVSNDDPFTDFEEAPQVRTSIESKLIRRAAFGAYDLRIGKDWVVTPGVRMSHTTQIDRSVLDPRLKTRYQLTQDVLLKMAVGQYSRSPQPQESAEGYGNPDLDYEKVMHYVLGSEVKFSDKWQTDVQIYAKSGRDMVRSHPTLRQANTGYLRSQGFELFLRRNRTKKFFGWLSYTYSKTEEKQDADSDWLPAEIDQTHVLTLVGQMKAGGQFSYGGRMTYHTGDRYTPVADAVYNAGLGKYQPRYNEDERYGARLSDYFQMDLYGVYDFLFDEWKLKFRFGVEYLAPKRPAFGVSYNYDYSKKEELTGIPPIFYIELLGEKFYRPFYL